MDPRNYSKASWIGSPRGGRRGGRLRLRHRPRLRIAGLGDVGDRLGLRHAPPPVRRRPPDVLRRRRSGPHRKYYGIKHERSRAAQTLRATWESFAEAMDGLLGVEGETDERRQCGCLGE